MLRLRKAMVEFAFLEMLFTYLLSPGKVAAYGDSQVF